MNIWVAGFLPTLIHTALVFYLTEQGVIAKVNKDRDLNSSIHHETGQKFLIHDCEHRHFINMNFPDDAYDLLRSLCTFQTPLILIGLSLMQRREIYIIMIDDIIVLRVSPCLAGSSA